MRLFSLAGGEMNTTGFKRSAKDYIWWMLAASIAVFIAIVWTESKFGVLEFDRANWLFLLAGFSALIGWLTTALVALRNSTKQHTINVLLQSRLSTAFNQRVDAFNKVFPYGTDITAADLAKTDDDTKAALEGVKYLLNYHEFVATGIRHKDLDHDMLKDSIQGIVVGLARKAKPYIVEKRAANSETLQHFMWLVDLWTAK